MWTLNYKGDSITKINANNNSQLKSSLNYYGSHLAGIEHKQTLDRLEGMRKSFNTYESSKLLITV